MAQYAFGTAKLISDLIKEGELAYREAIALQVEKKDSREAWERWQQITAALLLSSWASGAVNTVKTAGIPSQNIDTPVARFALEETKTVNVGSLSEEVAMRFEAGPAREVVRRYIRLLPLTRQKWEALIDHALAAAQELQSDEAANALDQIIKRSPDLASVLRPNITGSIPKGSDSAKARAVTQGSFFVTGMTQEQVEKTQDLLAKVIRQQVTTSAAGKKLEHLGVGDFVEQTVLNTGTDLTAARLETIYRTNLNRAQSQGQLDICRDETVKAFVPLMQFTATKDKRTRDTHRAMDGYIATVEQIDAMGISTPLGFNCRCAWKPIPLAVAYGKGWCDEDGKPDYDSIRKHNGSRQVLIDKGLVPDSGFISG